MKRKILAIVLGLVAGLIFHIAVMAVSAAMYPPPSDIDWSDREAVRAHFSTLPLTSFLIVLIAHAGGSLVSGLVVGLVAMRRWLLPAGIIGGFWTLGGITNLFLLPQPVWMSIVDLLLYIPAALVGVTIGGALTSKKGGGPIATAH